MEVNMTSVVSGRCTMDFFIYFCASFNRTIVACKWCCRQRGLKLSNLTCFVLTLRVIHAAAKWIKLVTQMWRAFFFKNVKLRCHPKMCFMKDSTVQGHDSPAGTNMMGYTDHFQHNNVFLKATHCAHGMAVVREQKCKHRDCVRLHTSSRTGLDTLWNVNITLFHHESDKNSSGTRQHPGKKQENSQSSFGKWSEAGLNTAVWSS